MKKMSINTLCYSAMLGLVGCNHVNHRMGMMQEVSKHPTADSASACSTQVLGNSEELEDRVKSVDIERFFHLLQSLLEQLFGKEVAKYVLKSTSKTLENLRKKGETVMELFQKVPMGQSEIEKWFPSLNLGVPELYYRLRIKAGSDTSGKEESIAEKINEKFEKREDLNKFMQTCKDGVSKYLEPLKKDIDEFKKNVEEVSPLISEWTTLSELAEAIGVAIEEIMGIVNHEGADEVSLELASPLPDKVKALLERILGWTGLSNKVQAVLKAEASVKLLMHEVMTIQYGKTYVMYEKQLGQCYKDKMNNVMLYTNALFTSVKKITLSAENIWPELAGVLQENRKELAGIIQQQQSALLEKGYKQDLDTINQAMQKRTESLEKLEKTLRSKAAK